MLDYGFKVLDSIHRIRVLTNAKFPYYSTDKNMYSSLMSLAEILRKILIKNQSE